MLLPAGIVTSSVVLLFSTTFGGVTWPHGCAFQCMLSQFASCTQPLCAGQSGRLLGTAFTLGPVCCGRPLHPQIWCIGFVLVLPRSQSLCCPSGLLFLATGSISRCQPLPLSVDGTFHWRGLVFHSGFFFFPSSSVFCCLKHSFSSLSWGWHLLDVFVYVSGFISDSGSESGLSSSSSPPLVVLSQGAELCEWDPSCIVGIYSVLTFVYFPYANFWVSVWPSGDIWITDVFKTSSWSPDWPVRFQGTCCCPVCPLPSPLVTPLPQSWSSSLSIQSKWCPNILTVDPMSWHPA